jgi:hypothetical protein
MGILGDQMMTIEEMRDALVEDEIEYIHSFSSKNLFHYVKDKIISTHSDDEVREIYYGTIGEIDETD